MNRHKLRNRDLNLTILAELIDTSPLSESMPRKVKRLQKNKIRQEVLAVSNRTYHRANDDVQHSTSSIKMSIRRRLHSQFSFPLIFCTILEGI